MAADKCVHKGCGKTFSDDNEECIYHPGPPVFHEGQKGWKCCKPRVLTFDEFMSIPPCTTGKHSTIDDTPVPPPPPPPASVPEPQKPQSESSTTPLPRLPVTTQAIPLSSSTPAQPQPDDDSDDPDNPIPANLPCKRKSCTAVSTPSGTRSDNESCTHHPGAPVFHEGSKGWTCCKRRVLDFDDFLAIPGCTVRPRHCFIGKTVDKSGEEKKKVEELLQSVRSDFYQTSGTVTASLYLKKIEQGRSRVEIVGADVVELDLRTGDGKRLRERMELWGDVDEEKSSWRIMGTKIEFEFVKRSPGVGWPVLRKSDKGTGEIIQTGRAGRA